MLLAVDVGNTQTTIELFDEEGCAVHAWRMTTDPSNTSDELHAKLQTFFAISGLELLLVSDAALATVVPVLGRAWSVFLERLLGHAPLLVSAALDCGIAVRMPEPDHVGADRIANAVAAVEDYGAPVIVVDFGTCTNIDVVDSTGAFRGGVIAPGLMLSAHAMFARAARLPAIPIEPPSQTLGDTTTSAMQAGIVIGAAAMAEGLVGRVKDELGAPQATVVATGGLARTVSRTTTLFDAIDPDLTLRGIRLIWLKQQN